MKTTNMIEEWQTAIDMEIIQLKKNENIGMSDMDIELGGKTGKTFKNTLQSVIGSDSFRNQVKNKMTGEICAELKKVSDKMDGKAEEIRNTIIG